jgi:hypothetical protein
MSYYVKRTRIADGRVGWTGPIRSERQAQRERAAWTCEAPYDGDGPAQHTAEVYVSTPEVRAAVRAWAKAKVSR